MRVAQIQSLPHLAGSDQSSSEIHSLSNASRLTISDHFLGGGTRTSCEGVKALILRIQLYPLLHASLLWEYSSPKEVLKLLLPPQLQLQVGRSASGTYAELARTWSVKHGIQTSFPDETPPLIILQGRSHIGGDF